MKKGWSTWSIWSPCSKECMAGESQGRSRQCLDETGTSMDDVRPCVDLVSIFLLINIFELFIEVDEF